MDEDRGLMSGQLAVLYLTGDNGLPASAEPVTHAGWGHFELDVGHSPSHLSLYDLIV